MRSGSAKMLHDVKSESSLADSFLSEALSDVDRITEEIKRMEAWAAQYG